MLKLSKIAAIFHSPSASRNACAVAACSGSAKCLLSMLADWGLADNGRFRLQLLTNTLRWFRVDCFWKLDLATKGNPGTPDFFCIRSFNVRNLCSVETGFCRLVRVWCRSKKILVATSRHLPQSAEPRKNEERWWGRFSICCLWNVRSFSSVVSEIHADETCDSFFSWGNCEVLFLDGSNRSSRCTWSRITLLWSALKPLSQQTKPPWLVSFCGTHLASKLQNKKSNAIQKNCHNSETECIFGKQQRQYGNKCRILSTCLTHNSTRQQAKSSHPPSKMPRCRNKRQDLFISTFCKHLSETDTEVQWWTTDHCA